MALFLTVTVTVKRNRATERVGSGTLEKSSLALTDADAQGGEAVAALASAELVEQ